MNKSAIWCRLYMSTLLVHITATWWRSFLTKIQQGKVGHFANPPKNGPKSSKMPCKSIIWRSWEVIHIWLSSSYQYLSNDMPTVHLWSKSMELYSTVILSATDCMEDVPFPQCRGYRTFQHKWLKNNYLGPERNILIIQAIQSEICGNLGWLAGPWPERKVERLFVQRIEQVEVTLELL
jgi:hypothetical protein